MNYYGVTRSTDHLAHYGVKGMKWGVRRAIARKNDKSLDRHYKKAAKKLAKLQDIGLNPKKYAAKAAAYGAAAAGVGTIAIKGLNFNALKSSSDSVKSGLNRFGPGTIAKGVAGAASVGLAGASVLNAYRAANGRKYREKALRWKNAMDDTFKGTKYEDKYAVPVKKKRKVRHFNVSKSTTFDEFSNPDFLAHYGIKGMKWGVKKAIASGDNLSLDKHYNKAKNKLDKLNKKADAVKQRQLGLERLKEARSAAGNSAGLAAAAGLSGGANYLLLTQGRIAPFALGLTGLSAGTSVFELGRSAYNLGRGIKHKINASKHGNAKAVAKRNAWRNQMAEVFKGTKYSKLPKYTNENSNRRKSK